MNKLPDQSSWFSLLLLIEICHCTQFSALVLKSCRCTFPIFQEARETGALKEAKDKLEKKVEELTWRLQFEKRLRVIHT